jgi:hypothetical protein
MFRGRNAMHFERLCNISCAYDEGLGKAALTQWRVEAICDEKRMFRELGTPCDDGRHQCRVQRLLWARVGGIAPVDGCILWYVHVQTGAEVRRVEEWETRMDNLEVDLDEVKRESENGWHAERR